MDFRIAKNELTRALGRVQGIVEKRSTNPIIANVLLEVDGSEMRVSATDTEVSFVGTYPVECKAEGSITLGARQLYDIARLVPTDEVHFEQGQGSNQVEIRSGRSYFKVLGLAAQDFPSIPEPEELSGFEVEASALKDLVDKTLFAISSDDTRTGLNGAHLETGTGEGGDAVRLVATDGHRLSLCGRSLSGGETSSRSVLLPKKGLSELRKLAEEEDSSWNVAFSDNQAVFRRGGVAFSMRLLEGDFPDYNQVIPGSWQRRVVVQREAIVQALRRVSILAPEKAHPVRFQIQSGSLTIVARQPEAGEATEEIEAEVEGDDLEVGFNARYFLDALQVLNSDTVALELGDSLSPTLIKPGAPESDELYVVMPMRLD